MQAEFEVAVQDGKGWSFSVGCLIAAWRELPAHTEGRLLLARYTVAFGLIIPIAVLLLPAALLRILEVHSVVSAFDLGQTGRDHLINDGNRAAAPLLPQLVLAIGAMRLGSAWAVLDRNWTRVAALERLSAAATITLAVFAALARLDAACAILPATALLVEFLALSALARLHDRTTLVCDA